MAYNKIGFHASIPGNLDGIGLYFQALDAAGIPAVIKCADSYGPCFELGNLARSSGVKHTIVFRLTTAGQDDGNDYDVPAYHLTPEAAAVAHWNMTKAKLPPEFQKDVCWLESVNEVDKNKSDWLGRFGVAIAALAFAEGYKICLPGWSSGEPEIAHWETPGMLALLQKAADNPTRLAISIHEYSFDVIDIRKLYPYLVGRFQFMFGVCDLHGVKRPTTIITEWGWELDKVPDPTTAMAHIADIAAVYAKHPQIIGAAIWNLGEYQGTPIHNLTQKLIVPVTDFTLNTTFPDTEEPPMTLDEQLLTASLNEFTIQKTRPGNIRYPLALGNWQQYLGNVRHVPAHNEIGVKVENKDYSIQGFYDPYGKLPYEVIAWNASKGHWVIVEPAADGTPIPAPFPGMTVQ